MSYHQQTHASLSKGSKRGRLLCWTNGNGCRTAVDLCILIGSLISTFARSCLFQSNPHTFPLSHASRPNGAGVSCGLDTLTLAPIATESRVTV